MGWMRTDPHSRRYPDPWQPPGQLARGLCLITVLSMLLAAQAVIAENSATDPAVKMSRSGICHERGTVHYQQTIYFEAFDSMESCLAANGRRMGGEHDDAQPQPVYRGTHPPRYYRPYVIGGGIAAAALIAGAAYLWRRRKAKLPLRDFQNRERRRWEGHKLESKKPPRH